MNLEKQVNNTVAKLIKKYESTTWDIVMKEVLQDASFKLGLKKLMKNHAEGNKFQPAFKEIFKPFTEQPLDEVDVVIVYPDATKELPEYETDRVLIVRCPLADGEGSNYKEVWKPFVKKLLEDIAYKTKKTIFVFAGKDSEEFKSIARKNQAKVFIPTDPDFEVSKITDNINDLLKRLKKEPIKW